MENELVCPHCGYEQQCHEPDEISAEMCLTECESCDKPFWYSVVVTRSYDATPPEDEED